MIAVETKMGRLDTETVAYHVELPAVRHGTDKLNERLERFAARYETILAGGGAVSVTDNPMGKLAFAGHELIEELRLPVPADRVMIHLNTFHTLAGVTEILDHCARLGVRRLLIVSGDGSPRLPKLRPAELGTDGEAVTSVELLAWIRRRYGDFFTLGVAFNQYEPPEHEYDKLRRKLDAGADFVITQPVVAPTAAIDRLIKELPVPVLLEAWMSPKIELLSECIGYPVETAGEFAPVAALRQLEEHYSTSTFYLSLLNFKDWDEVNKGRRQG